MAAKSLQDKVAIVTGGSRGIGAGIAKELAKRGASVLITYASASARAEEVVADIEKSGGKAASVKADCTHPDAPKLVIDTAVKTFDGGIDIIINNAGAGDEMWLKDVTYEHFDKLVNTNMRFPIFLVQKSLPYLRKGGRIVNVSSVAARQGFNMHTVYGGTKAALESVTRTWAVELGHEYGVTVNSINPGPVATDMWFAMPEDALEGTDDYMKNTPAAPRIGEVDDIVQIVAFLSEEGSRWVNGSNTCANGGALFS